MVHEKAESLEKVSKIVVFVGFHGLFNPSVGFLSPRSAHLQEWGGFWSLLFHMQRLLCSL
jgi:hypothetical protein